MVVVVSDELSEIIAKTARRIGVTPDKLILDALRERFLPSEPASPNEEWEQRLRSAASDCGTRHTDEQLSREALYE